MANIAVVILNYNSWQETLEEAQLVNRTCGINYEDIIIVDNNSPNNSEKELRKNAHKGYIFIESGTNKGYAAGNNIGLKYAYEHGYDYAWILNNDILIDDNLLLKKMIEVFEKDDFIAVVNPDIYSPDGHMFNRDSKKPTLFDYTVGINYYRKKGRMVNNLGGYAYVYRPQGCCMVVDLKKINEVDYMDEYTFLYYEEPILAERLLMKKYRCACCLEAKVIHDHSRTVRSVLKKEKIIKTQNNSFKYYLKKYRKFNMLAVKLCEIFNVFKLIILE